MYKIRTVFIFLFTMRLSAESLALTVMDRDLGWPLEGVMIQVVGSDEVLFTGSEGEALLVLPDDRARIILTAQLPGYESIRRTISPGENVLKLEMVIYGVVEGEELVVERSVPGESDEIPGVSVVMSAEDMDTTANVGIVEDVMSSIKTLPGVTYSGSFNAQPSIRGGDPDSMAAMLDGIYVTSPYHWGGAFSIFNPNMTESAKLSHGVFSARYGRALSGILEVTTKTPDEEIRADVVLSTTSTELFVQMPLSEDMGLFLGGKITYLDTAVWANQKLDQIPTPPYIRDFYGKWYFKPTNNMEISLNGFFGSDGIGADVETEEDGITSDIHFDHDNLNAFSTLGLTWSLNPRNLLILSGGYNYNETVTSADIEYSGTREYSSEFAGDNASLLAGATEYSLDGIGFEYENSVRLHQGQGRVQWDYLVSDGNLLSFGVDEVFLYSDSSLDFDGYTELYGSYGYTSFSSSEEGNKTVNSSAYGVWEFGAENSEIQGELGVRGEHYLLWNGDTAVQTYPMANPRLQVRWSPPEVPAHLDDMTLSLGSGLFSQFPLDTSSSLQGWDVDDFDIGPDQAFYQTLGGEIRFLEDWTFQLEGYYKYFFNRLYVTTGSSSGTSDYRVHQDGTGHALGFDFMIKRDLGWRLDGYLSYSFVYTRLLNPYSGSETMVEPSGAPLDQWYYPDYHRFHTLNLVLNWRFRRGWKLTTSATFASGTPMEETGDIYAEAYSYNGQIVERYERDSWYSDTLRTDFSLPVNLRLSYTRYKKGSKWEQEFYFAIEDVFAGIYSPEGATEFSHYTGQEEPGSAANFELGIPIPSIGFKASY